MRERKKKNIPKHSVTDSREAAHATTGDGDCIGTTSEHGLSDDEGTLKDINIVGVRLVRENVNPYEGKIFNNPKSLAWAAKEFLGDRDREIVITFNLDARFQINSVHVVSVGSSTSALVAPSEVFKAAILSNAKYIAVAHNHPSGVPDPSGDDLKITAKLLQSGDILGIEVIDHFIIGVDHYKHIIKTGKDFFWAIEKYEKQ